MSNRISIFRRMTPQNPGDYINLEVDMSPVEYAEEILERVSAELFEKYGDLLQMVWVDLDLKVSMFLSKSNPGARSDEDE